MLSRLWKDWELVIRKEVTFGALPQEFAVIDSANLAFPYSEETELSTYLISWVSLNGKTSRIRPKKKEETEWYPTISGGLAEYAMAIFGAAIVAEIIATSVLKGADGFTRLIPLDGHCRVATYAHLSLTLRTMPLGIALHL